MSKIWKIVSMHKSLPNLDIPLTELQQKYTVKSLKILYLKKTSFKKMIDDSFKQYIFSDDIIQNKLTRNIKFIYNGILLNDKTLLQDIYQHSFTNNKNVDLYLVRNINACN